MGFLSDFATGFFQTSAETLDRRKQIEEADDLDKRKRVNEINAQKVLIEHKAKVEAEAEERKLKALREAELEDVANFYKQYGDKSNTGAVGNVDVPSTTTPTDPIAGEQLNTWLASQAARRGDDNTYKSRQAQADVFKLERERKKQIRTEGREGVTSLEGLKPYEELAKEDNEVLAKPDIDSTLYFKYFGEPRALSTTNEDDLEAIAQVKQSSAEAVKLTNILTSATSDERGISDKGSGELKADAINLVRLKNQYAMSVDEQEKEAILANIVDIADNYPSAEGLVLSTIGVDKLLQDQGYISEAPAESAAEPSINTQEEFDALPSGSVYIDAADGKKYRKP